MLPRASGRDHPPLRLPPLLRWRARSRRVHAPSRRWPNLTPCMQPTRGSNRSLSPSTDDGGARCATRKMRSNSLWCSDPITVTRACVGVCTVGPIVRGRTGGKAGRQAGRLVKGIVDCTPLLLLNSSSAHGPALLRGELSNQPQLLATKGACGVGVMKVSDGWEGGGRGADGRALECGYMYGCRVAHITEVCCPDCGFRNPYPGLT